MRAADLPWYDLPDLSAATDAWWQGIARHLRAQGVDGVPDALSRDDDCRERWADPQLLLSQACGYDVLYDARPLLLPVAAPVYAIAGCRGPRYTSESVVREQSPFRDLASLRGTRVAINEACSHSGCNAMRPLFAGLLPGERFFGGVHETGSHTRSLVDLRRGRCDVACVDAVVIGLMRNLGDTRTDGLRLLARTAPALAPPYVTSRSTGADVVAALRRALDLAAADPELADCRRRLCITGFVPCAVEDYDELRAFEAPAIAASWFELPAPATSPLSAGDLSAGGLSARALPGQRPPDQRGA